MITTRTIRTAQLSHSQICDWECMVRSNPWLTSPFFRPEFTLAVGRVRTDVRIIVVEKQDVPVAFLPFQLAANGEHIAVGASLNDFQGVISTPDARFSMDKILRHAGVRRMFCPKLMDGQHRFDSFVVAENASPFVDLSNGYCAWEEDLKRRGAGLLKRLARKERKLVRDLGTVHLEYHTTSTGILQQLITWKKNQYRRTNEKDTFAVTWTNALLHNLLAVSQDSELQPLLSAMYAGKKLIAAHYCLTAQGVCHSWIPAYDPAFRRYSPGKLLLRRLLFEAPERSIERFDFGAGDEPYKYQFANDASSVRRVMIDRNPLRRWVRSNAHHARISVKHSLIGPRLIALRDRLQSAIRNVQPAQEPSSLMDTLLETIAIESSVTTRPEVKEIQQDAETSASDVQLSATSTTSH